MVSRWETASAAMNTAPTTTPSGLAKALNPMSRAARKARR